MKKPTRQSGTFSAFVSKCTNTPKVAERLTTARGVVIADNQNSLRIGSPVPGLLEDFALREKSFDFDHERIPAKL